MSPLRLRPPPLSSSAPGLPLLVPADAPIGRPINDHQTFRPPQITDVEIDRVNKPYLPIPAGNLTPRGAKATVTLCLLAGVALGLTPCSLGSPGLAVSGLVGGRGNGWRGWELLPQIYFFGWRSGGAVVGLVTVLCFVFLVFVWCVFFFGGWSLSGLRGRWARRV